MDHFTACRVLFSLEQFFNVNEYRVAGEPLWPYFRMAFRNLASNRQAVDTMAPEHPLVHLRARVDSFYEELCRPHIDASDSVIMAGESQAVHVMREAASAHSVFLTRVEEHYVREADGSLSAPILDPWVRDAKTFGRVTKLEIASKADRGSPRTVPVLKLAPDLRRRAPSDVFFQELKGLLGKVARVYMATFQATPPDLAEAIVTAYVNTQANADLLEASFAALEPSAVFYSCYYHPVGYGAGLAARRLNLPLIEVQHGSNGPYHASYTHFSAVPKDGYPTLPSHFATWSRRSARAIARWLPAHDGAPRVLVSGRPELGAGKEKTCSGGTSDKLGAFRAAYRKCILVTLQPPPEFGVTERLVEIIKASPVSWGWLIRLHPLTHGAASIREAAQAAAVKLWSEGLHNVETVAASEVPLPEALAAADHHLTHCSSCVAEAVSMGIPSTCIHPSAVSFFGDLIEDRYAALALTTSNIVDSIASGWDGLRRPDPDYILETRPDLRPSTIATILATGRSGFQNG